MYTHEPAHNKINLQRIPELKAKGIYPYARNFARTHSILDINETYDGIDDRGKTVSLNLCGRVTKIDTAGKLIWVSLEDRDSKLQFLLDTDHISTDKMATFKENVSQGDFIGFKVNHIFCSERGSLVARVSDWYFLAACLVPLPEQITNRILQRQQRHLHLLKDFWARQRFIASSKVLRFIRRFLEDEADFIEVKTPTLQPFSGSVEVNPFKTTVKAADAQLRVSPHIYLKQLIIGGMERVYEICDVFLDEEVDWLHYPELQLLECCISPADSGDMMALTERIVSELANYLQATYVILWNSLEDMQFVSNPKTDDANDPANFLPMSTDEFNEIPIDLTPPWPHPSFYQLVEEATQIDFLQLRTVNEALTAARQAGVEIIDTSTFSSVGLVAMEVINQLVAPQLIQPTFVVGYPVEASPNAKSYQNDPRLAEYAHLFINGLEFATVRSERTEFSPPSKHSHEISDDFMPALEYGMPPTGVLEMKLGLLTMLMTGTTDIRDTIIFPICG